MQAAKLPQPKHGLGIKQERSKLTYLAMLNTGFRMLEEQDIQDISVSDLVHQAGYSVGAFYSRFRSKDEFFEAMVEEHLERRSRTLQDIYHAPALHELPGVLIRNIVSYYHEHRNFWRAVISRSLRHEHSWDRMRLHRQENIQLFQDKLSKLLNRRLTGPELTNIAFAFQVVLGTIDIAVVNKPGPLQLGQEQFTAELTRTFTLVSGYDEILSA